MKLNPHEELLERARKVIRELKEKLAAAEARRQSAPVAVIGMGMRFPGCGTDLGQFWQMVMEGRAAIKPIPADRWDRDALYSPDAATPGKINTRYGAFLDDVRRFDAAFFDITPREAIRMDPQQRIFLETAWHALEDAGLPAAVITGSDAGIFVGVHGHSIDYQIMQFGDPATLDAYAGSGTAQDMIGARLAYWLDLHGPAVTVNTACSSSLTAVHLACRSLRAGDCSVAFAGGVNLLLGSAFTVAAAQLQLLSPDGRCKTFDARADGMGRGEGCGVVVLKRLDAALQEGDRVLAVIRGSAVNQDGKTNGLTAPNGLAQQRVLRQALQDAGVQPWEIGFIEAHGTGTALGDPIEVEALAEVLGGGQRTAPCTLGAVKANVGHLEGAAGIAGLIKTILVLRHRWLPPLANLEKLNPHFSFHESVVSIPQSGRAWNTTGRRFAGVSSFGWSGTNVHVVLEEAPVSQVAVAAEQGILPVLVSAQSLEALRILATAFASRLEKADASELSNISYTSTLRRTHHAYRIAVTGTDAKEMAAQLRRRLEDATGAHPPDKIAASEPFRLNEMFLAWEKGGDVDWATAYPACGSVVDLPLYPFQGEPYWLSTASVAIATEASPNDGLRSDWFYATEWIEAPLETAADEPRTQSVTWLLLHAGVALALNLAEVIRQRGDRVVEGVGGKDFDRLTRAREAPHFVVYFVSGEHPAGITTDALELTQSAIRSGIALKVWFITDCAEWLEDREVGFHPLQASMRGFSRIFGLEHPDLAGGVIDTDSADARNAEAIYGEIIGAAGEDRVALRQGRRWVARLRRDPPATQKDQLRLRPGRCYLVTGAFCRLGMEIASWLVGRGARILALVDRRAPVEIGSSELLATLEGWRARGIQVIAEACDVSDESQVRRLLTQLDASGPRLSGIVHAAAGLRFSSIVQALPQDVDIALRANVEGARVLDLCTREEHLDFFVLFGSAASAIGLRNGALYAAASACLGAIAFERHALGLPALCAEWGLWEHSGEDAQQQPVEHSGFAAVRADRALACLGAAMDAGRAVQILADIDWKILGPALEMRGRAALVKELVAPPTAAVTMADVQQKAWLEELAILSPQERRNRLLDFVGEETRTVFGMPPSAPLDEERGLFELGMDSLMSATLTCRLEEGTGLRLPETLTLTYPTITALAAYLEKALFASTDTPSVIAQPSLRREPDLSLSVSVTGMSESETNAAIAAELAAIQQKLGVL